MRPRSAFAALSPEQINPKIKDMEYAVRGQLVINAMVRRALSRRAVVPDPRLETLARVRRRVTPVACARTDHRGT